MKKVSAAELRAERRQQRQQRAAGGGGGGDDDAGEGGGDSDGAFVGYKLNPLLWTLIKPRLKPAEVPEFKRVLGSDIIRRNKELHVEASALAEIYSEYCRESQMSIEAVYTQRASMPQPPSHGLLLNEIAMLVDKLQATQVGVPQQPPNQPLHVRTSSLSPSSSGGRGRGGSGGDSGGARPSTPLAVTSIAQDRQEVLWRMLQEGGGAGGSLSPRLGRGRASSPSSLLRRAALGRPGSAESPSRRGAAGGLRSLRRRPGGGDSSSSSPHPHADTAAAAARGGGGGGSGDMERMRLLFAAEYVPPPSPSDAAADGNPRSGSRGKSREKKREKRKEKKKSKKSSKAKGGASGKPPTGGSRCLLYTSPSPRDRG